MKAGNEQILLLDQGYEAFTSYLCECFGIHCSAARIHRLTDANSYKLRARCRAIHVNAYCARKGYVGLDNNFASDGRSSDSLRKS